MKMFYVNLISYREALIVYEYRSHESAIETSNTE